MALKQYMVLIILVFILSGCHSFNRINSTVQESLKVGDEVSLTTVKGSKFHFIITKIDYEFLYYKKGGVIKISEIENIYKAEKDSTKTTKLVSSIIAGVIFGAWFLMYTLGGV